MRPDRRATRSCTAWRFVVTDDGRPRGARPSALVLVLAFGLAVACGLGGCATPASVAPPNPADVGVWSWRTDGVRGSAVSVGPDRLLTAAHVLRDPEGEAMLGSRPIRYRVTASGRPLGGRAEPRGVDMRDHDGLRGDWAVLELTEGAPPPPPPRPPLPIAAPGPVGTELHVVGFALGQAASFRGVRVDPTPQGAGDPEDGRFGPHLVAVQFPDGLEFAGASGGAIVRWLDGRWHLVAVCGTQTGGRIERSDGSVAEVELLVGRVIDGPVRAAIEAVIQAASDDVVE